MFGQVGGINKVESRHGGAVTAEDAWCNPWRNEGSLPDYSHIQEQLSALRVEHKAKRR